MLSENTDGAVMFKACYSVGAAEAGAGLPNIILGFPAPNFLPLSIW
jgi:hypothetical protein